MLKKFYEENLDDEQVFEIVALDIANTHSNIDNCIQYYGYYYLEVE